ncbi:hypothetical protein BBF96_11595 [Anoxybacter fermentans]|uniref:Methyltransferase domain-containing protein n=1 Tax=Anoxybacter fermentans TaxID=1323375 RepID=A0A3Q9HR89_9FIRM|nr:hypothetical protein BBF96_11595 [Anoxybacter fermentans]
MIDFDCGHGKILFRCLELGIRSIVGIDISPMAIVLAKKLAVENGVENKSEFWCGDSSILSRINDQSFDAGILFNIIDNLMPEDGLKVLKYEILLRNILR